MMRFPGIVTSAALLLTTGAAADSIYKPDVIGLPLGFFPEGIAIGHGWTAYVGSLSGKINLNNLDCMYDTGTAWCP